MRLRVKETFGADQGRAARSSHNSSSVKFVLNALNRRKWLIILIFVVMSSAITAYTILTPNRYKSAMKILVKNERIDAAVSAEDHTWADRTKVSEEMINSEIELLKSRDLIQIIAEKLHPDRKGAAGEMTKELENAIRDIQNNLDINPVKKSDIIEVNYNDKSPEYALNVLTELSVGYLDKHLKIHRTPGAYEFFKSETERYKKQMIDIQLETNVFRKKYAVTDLDTQKKLNLNYMSDMEKFMLRAAADAVDSEKRVMELRKNIAALPKRILTQQREIPNQFTIERMNTLMVDLQHKRTQLATRYQETDRLVVEIDKQIADTRAALEKAEAYKAVENQTDPNPIRMALEPELAKAEATWAGAKGQRDRMAMDLEAYRRRQLELEQTTIKYTNLERSLKEAEDNYKLYSKKEEEARIANQLDQEKIANVVIVEAPTKSLTPYKPNRPMTIAVGLAMALLVGLSAAFLMEYFKAPPENTEVLDSLAAIKAMGVTPFWEDELQRERLDELHWERLDELHGEMLKELGIPDDVPDEKQMIYPL